MANGTHKSSRTDFHDLLSGRLKGVVPAAVRGLLRTAEFPYRWVVNRRNHRFDQGKSPTQQVSVPVISVGNLTTGGTGKTPLVAWLSRWFLRQQVRVGLVSRGYKSTGQRPNDEALELQRQLPDVPHVQDRDRVSAARVAIEQFGCQVIILDDAFQHRRIYRDLDIVLIDALEPFGYGHLLPRGLLREPIEQLTRAGMVALSRAEMIAAERRQCLRQQVQRLAPHADWVELAHQPIRLMQVDGSTRPLACLAGSRVAAFSAIGNPEGFRRSLAQLGCQIIGFRTYRDHHAFTAGDLVALQQWLSDLGPLAAVVCTGKDLVKFEVTQLGDLPLLALAVEIDVLNGRAELENRLQAILHQVHSNT